MSTDTHQPWLQRVSNYHSGDVSATERQAVEDHLLTCAECQAALAEYQRFYVLAGAPLRLGSPAISLRERTTSMETHPLSDDAATATKLVPIASRRAMPIIAAALVVVLLSVVVFGLIRSQPMTGNNCNPKAIIPAQSRITAISMTSATDGWAVAYSQDALPFRSFLLHYQNCRWRSFGNPFNGVALKSISMASATDGWAVGYGVVPSSDGSGVSNITHQVTLHYTDGVWRNTPMLADVGSRGGVFPEVQMLSSQSGWMLALCTDPATYATYVLLRYQQGAWVKVAMPPLTIDAYIPLVAIAPDEFFLLAGHVDGVTVHTNVIAHYVKGIWATWTGPSDVTLANITATPTGQMWAAGSQMLGNDSHHTQLYLQRFDGQTWRAVPVPLAQSVAAGNKFDGGGLAMFSANEGWMTMFGDTQNYILHLQDGQWQPELSEPFSTFIEILQMVSPMDGWAISHDASENAPNSSTLYHYNGKQWRAVGS